MTYCPKCGKENDEGGEYCRFCGEKLPSNVTYVKTRETGWSIGRIVSVLVGGIMLLTAFGLIMGGGSLRLIQDTIVDPDDYMMSGFEDIQVNSYAVVFKEIDINIDDDLSEFIRRVDNLVTLKINVENNDPTKTVFVGLAETNDIRDYFNDVEYTEFRVHDWNYDPWGHSFPDYSLRSYSGDAPESTPDALDYWTLEGSDAEEVTLTWNPVGGSYWLVIMNEDASENVDVNVQIGVRIPIMKWIVNILFSVGIVVALIGAAIIYYGAIRR